MQQQVASGSYVLGLDLGSHSLGWAIVNLDTHDQPTGIRMAGVRCFEAGKDASHDEIMKGKDKDKSRAAVRRGKRLPRRQFWRRARRRFNVLKNIIAHGLFPSPGSMDLRNPAEQDQYLKNLDVQLQNKLRPLVAPQQRHLWEQVWLYELRASALERPLDVYELGRVFYHLAQRRGFLSNRKTDKETESDENNTKPRKSSKKTRDTEASAHTDTAGKAVEKQGKEKIEDVKASIAQLDRDIEQAITDPGKRTLGYYFARHVHPQEARIRHRWIGRSDAESKYNYEGEFNAIWEAQKVYHGELLTDDFRLLLASRTESTSIFYQRPLKPAGHLIGHCSLEPRRRRASQAIPLAQEFRLLDKVNNLEVMDPEGSKFRKLEEHQRRKLIEALSKQGDMTFAQIRKELGFATRKVDKKTGEVIKPGHDFNLEVGPEKDKGLPGDRTYHKLVAAEEKAPGILDRWHAMSENQKERLVLDLLDFRSAIALVEHLEKLGFSPQQAQQLAKVKLEDKRCALSKRAMSRLMPYLREGMTFGHAKQQVQGYEALEQRRTAVHDLLPRVLATDARHLSKVPSFKHVRDLPNPSVIRALSELPKVVNHLIRQFGKPRFIRIELGRELQKTPKRRAEDTKRIEENRKARESAAKALIDAHGFVESEIRENDKKKYLLYQEQRGHCPYCGKHFDPSGIRSGNLQMDHIIPESISLDSSMANITLCCADCNARKGKNTPWRQWGGDPQKMHEIELTVQRFSCSIRKRERFGWDDKQVREYYGDDNGGFTKRQLHDTQHASRLAGEYLGLLYGGVIDEDSVRRVQTPSGGTTHLLRTEWGLNGVLPSLPDSPTHQAPENVDLDQKLRTDHRHHAVDAVVIALTDQRTVGFLNHAAARIENARLNQQDMRDRHGKLRKRFAEFTDEQMPWGTRETFFDSVRAAVASLVVSHRAEHKIQGQLHKETIYGHPRPQTTPTQPSTDKTNDDKQAFTERVELKDMSVSDLQKDLDLVTDWAKKGLKVKDAPRTRIVDPYLAAHIVTQWEKLGRPKPEVFANTANLPINGKLKIENGRIILDPAHPGGKTPDGKPVYIKSARMWFDKQPRPIFGRDGQQRYIMPGNNHHTVIVQHQNKGEIYWDDYPCTLLDAVDRLRKIHVARSQGQPVPSIVQKDWTQQGGQYVMWFAKGDYLVLKDNQGIERIYECLGISKGDLTLRYHTDARSVDSKANDHELHKVKPIGIKKMNHTGKAQVIRVRTAEDLRLAQACKVTVSPTGQVHPCND